MANSVDPDQTPVCSGSTLFASILDSSVMLGNYLQQTTSADDIFRCIFFLKRCVLTFLAKRKSENRFFQYKIYCLYTYVLGTYACMQWGI